MSNGNWQVVKEIFEECLTVDQPERDAILAARDLSPEVRDEVRRLLDHHNPADDTFLAPIGNVRTFLQPARLFSEGDIVGGRFRIVRFLGAGGMGEVYSAQDLDAHNDLIALKVISPEICAIPQAEARFRREWRLASGISHPNVCKLYGFYSHISAEGTASFFTMEFIQGETLDAILRRKSTPDSAQLFEIVDQILAGLAQVHSLNIVHRDLKPSNIMIRDQPLKDTPRSGVVLMDFGLARSQLAVSSQNLSNSGAVLGTLNYLAPEQLNGAAATPLSDIYSFGLILYELLAGARPFEGDGPESIFLRLRRSPPSLRGRGVERHWASVVEACLQINPADRPTSAQLIRDLLGRRTGFSLAYRARIHRRALLASIGAAALSSVGLELWSRRLHASRGVKILLAGDSSAPTPTDLAAVYQMRRTLAQSAYLTLWNPDKLGEVWTRMGRHGTPKPTTADWREIAFRENVALILFTSLKSAGAISRLALRVEQIGNNPEYPRRSWQREVSANNPTQLLRTIGEAGQWVRSLVGETQAEIESSTVPPENVTTPSWRALVDFSSGERALAAHDYETALLDYDSALRFDRDFTMAWMRKGDVQLRVRDERSAFEAYARALETSKTRPLTRREDLRFRSMLLSDAGDFAAAEKIFAEYFHRFPHESYGPFYRSLPLLLMGYVEQAINNLKISLAFGDCRERAKEHLSWAYLFNDDQTAAQAWIEALHRSGSKTRASYAQAAFSYVRGDADRSLAALDEASRDGTVLEDPMKRVYRISVLADCGMPGRALEEALANASRDQSLGFHAYRTMHLISAAYLLHEMGNSNEALKTLQVLDRSALGPHHIGQAGALYARCGYATEAKALIALLPTSLSFPRFAVPRLRLLGELELTAGRSMTAIGQMRKAAALDIPAYGKEYLAYALLRSNRLAEAKAEYELCLKQKPLQLRIGDPEPAGFWNRCKSMLNNIHLNITKGAN